MIRVFVANCNVLTRIGLRTLFSSAQDIELVGEASDGFEARHLCKNLKPDVIVWDLNMPGPQSLKIISFLKSEQIEAKMVVFTQYKKNECIKELINAGVTGYVLIEEAEQAIIHAIRTVMHGGTWFSDVIFDMLISEKNVPPPWGEISCLTDREIKFLELISHGWENTRLAKHFCLSEQTARNYLKVIYTKINVHSRSEAILWARDHSIGGVWCEHSSTN